MEQEKERDEGRVDEQNEQQVDEAIIRLYQALHNNPPLTMIERMQKADVDGDSKLT